MVRRRDARAFALILYLWKLSKTAGATAIFLDYAAAATALGMDRMTPDGYRRQINKTLRKLDAKYGLIEVKTSFARNARIAFRRDIAGNGPGARIPHAFWDYGWNRTLSPAGVVMYLIHIANGQNWSASLKTLSARHHIPAYFLSLGNTELRRWNLVTITHDRLMRKDNKARKPNRYLPGALYDPKLEEVKLRGLREKHGAAALARARKLAALVYEDHDINGINTLIALETAYGRKAMRQAAAGMALKSPGNPKRNMGYLIGMIRGIGSV